jgi:hypothetical protein
MHKAKAFFFVCLGLLCIVAAYHLGASSAGAQVGAAIQGLEVGPGGVITFVRSGVFYSSPNGRAGPYPTPAPVPGGSPVMATAAGGDGVQGMVVLEDGSVYGYDGIYSGTWQLLSNILGNATAAAQPTWGQLKSQYRGPSVGQAAPGPVRVAR